MHPERFKVLYIVSDNINAVLMRHVFIKKLPECELIEITDASTALSIAKAEPPAMVMMDIQFPETNEYDILAFLQSHEAMENVPIWAVSACALKDDVIKGIEAGFDRYITKPIDLEKFIRHIRRDIAC